MWGTVFFLCQFLSGNSLYRYHTPEFIRAHDLGVQKGVSRPIVSPPQAPQWPPTVVSLRPRSRHAPAHPPLSRCASAAELPVGRRKPIHKPSPGLVFLLLCLPVTPPVWLWDATHPCVLLSARACRTQLQRTRAAASHPSWTLRPAGARRTRTAPGSGAAAPGSGASLAGSPGTRAAGGPARLGAGRSRLRGGPPAVGTRAPSSPTLLTSRFFAHSRHPPFLAAILVPPPSLSFLRPP